MRRSKGNKRLLIFLSTMLEAEADTVLEGLCILLDLVFSRIVGVKFY